MISNDPQRPQGGIPWSLVGMIALIVAVEWFERRHYAQSNFLATSWADTSRRLDKIARGADILGFGDSLVKHGVQPTVLERGTGKKVGNLAMNNGAMPASYFLFRRALEQGCKPSVVLIDAADGILEQGPRSLVRSYTWSDMLTFREAAELSVTARDPVLFAQIELAVVLHSFKDRFEVRASVMRALRNEVPRINAVMPGYLRNWRVNSGAQVNPEGAYVELPPPPADRELPGTWTCDPVNRIYLEKTFSLAARHGVAVLWLLPPFPPVRQKHFRYQGIERRYNAFVREIAARHTNVTVVDGRFSGYDRTAFFDDAHLDRGGAAAYSSALAGMIRDRDHLAVAGASHRWVRLPDYRPAPTTPLLEDFQESNVAVFTRSGTVRR